MYRGADGKVSSISVQANAKHYNDEYFEDESCLVVSEPVVTHNLASVADSDLFSHLPVTQTADLESPHFVYPGAEEDWPE